MRIQRDQKLETVLLESVWGAMVAPRQDRHSSSLFPCAGKGKALEIPRPPLTDEDALFCSERPSHGS